MSKSLIAAALLSAFAVASFAQSAPSPTPGPTASGAGHDWAKDHPRRAEVNSRLRNQHTRIRNEVREGDLTQAQAKQLRKDDHQIRQEERDMAAQNGGHITTQEQRTLNQQETAVSKQIGN